MSETSLSFIPRSIDMSRVLALGVTLLVVATVVPAFARGPAAAGSGEQASPQQPQQQQPPAQQPPAQQPPAQPPQKPEEPPVYEEAVVVSAARVEQQIVNAPAAVSVITAGVIETTPATNYAELLRAVPGVNISQTSARDYNITIRGASSTLATSQLALVDGRSLYLDFFGFVAWDLLPMNSNEIRQIEVIRGPASAVWGANALNGVVNFISKTPRQLAADGDSVTISVGGFDASPGNAESKTGGLFSINATHAAAMNDRWAYKVSGGFFASDAFARPTGLIPGTTTPYPPFNNTDTKQPKFDGRADYEAPNGDYKLTVAGGYAATGGIIHTGIGPFDMDTVGLGYGTVRYSRKALRLNFFTNILDGDATALLSVGLDGQPIPFSFNTKTFDFEAGNVNTIGTRQVISYGGNVRYNTFNLSIAPRGDNRTELGAYIQDELFLHDRVRLNVGARIDKFDVIDDPVFSPRVALMIKPHEDHSIRLSYNKAFRSPSLINNFLDVTIRNSLNFAQLDPSLAPLGTFNFPTNAIGSEDLKQESTEVVELGYTAIIKKRATLTAAVYFAKNEDEIFFTQTGRYRALNPPPGWVAAFRGAVPPATALAVLEVLPPPCPSLTVPCTSGGLPSEFSYRNLGTNRNKGFELGIDGAVNQAVDVFANYSYQATPDPDFDISEVNIPPKNRYNVGLNYSEGRYLGNVAVSFVDDAFFQDVLDDRFHGPTKSYTQVNGAFGVRWADNKVTTTLKVINLTNEDIQSHVFGDVMKRQVIGEVRFQF
jgi:outer membrane receptor protein involved in Fe transport